MLQLGPLVLLNNKECLGIKDSGWNGYLSGLNANYLLFRMTWGCELVTSTFCEEAFIIVKIHIYFIYVPWGESKIKWTIVKWTFSVAFSICAMLCHHRLCSVLFSSLQEATSYILSDCFSLSLLTASDNYQSFICLYEFTYSGYLLEIGL